ncbi:hypothetical protein ONZ45_g735 [Pleurotus djamor]|nr:hypothetical protein ONZ45_g735 [Pleurotus djamor]
MDRRSNGFEASVNEGGRVNTSKKNALQTPTSITGRAGPCTKALTRTAPQSSPIAQSQQSRPGKGTTREIWQGFLGWFKAVVSGRERTEKPSQPNITDDLVKVPKEDCGLLPATSIYEGLPKLSRDSINLPPPPFKDTPPSATACLPPTPTDKSAPLGTQVTEDGRPDLAATAHMLSEGSSGPSNSGVAEDASSGLTATVLPLNQGSSLPSHSSPLKQLRLDLPVPAVPETAEFKHGPQNYPPVPYPSPTSEARRVEGEWAMLEGLTSSGEPKISGEHGIANGPDMPPARVPTSSFTSPTTTPVPPDMRPTTTPVPPDMRPTRSPSSQLSEDTQFYHIYKFLREFAHPIVHRSADSAEIQWLQERNGLTSSDWQQDQDLYFFRLEQRANPAQVNLHLYSNVYHVQHVQHTRGDNYSNASISRCNIGGNLGQNVVNNG